jgi:hypothetical protein
MSENTRVSYDVLNSTEAGWLAQIDNKAKIGADPKKGIPEDVEVPFKAVTFNLTTAAEASEAFEALGADVVNGLLNYAADLKLRARAVQAERARLTTDPLKKECKAVALLIGEENVARYRELRTEGHSQAEALAQLT